MGLYVQKRPVQALALATVLVVAASGFAHAACYGPLQQLPAKTVAQFTADPEQLLSKYPNGGARMVSMVRDLVASDPAALPFVLDLSPKSNAAQVNALGAGLGQAAVVCSRSDQTFANEVQQMVAAINNLPLTLTFTAVLGDQNHPAAGSGGGGGGEAVGATGSLGATSPAGTNLGAVAGTNLGAVAGTNLGAVAGTNLGAISPTGTNLGPVAGTNLGAITQTGATGSSGFTGPPGSSASTGLTGATVTGGSATNTGAIGFTVTTSALGTSSTGTLGASSTGATAAAGNGSQGTSGVKTAVNTTPSSFFTLSSNARGESVKTTNVSTTSSSVSPSR
jgi:hypothetical protein